MDLEHLHKFVTDVKDFPKKGIVFRDISPLLADPSALESAITYLVQPWLSKSIDIVAGAESRGFIFGAVVAQTLNAGFVPIRKPGKLPKEVYTQSYQLEYGLDELQIHQDVIKKNQRVLLVDDLLATGGTLRACTCLINKIGAEIAGCAVLIELIRLGGRDFLKPYKVTSVLEYS